MIKHLYTLKNLSIDAYDSDANFIAGNIYKALNSLYDAKEAYGWASRSTKYKSAALSQISEIYLIEKNIAMPLVTQKNLSIIIG